MSSSITQSALPAVSPCVASNKKRLPVVAELIVKATALLVCPEGKGLETVIAATPGDEMAEAGTNALYSNALIYVVDKAEPFQFMVAPFIKFDPEAVSVNPPPPAAAALGEVMSNCGWVLLAVTENVIEAETPPPGNGE